MHEIERMNFKILNEKGEVVAQVKATENSKENLRRFYQKFYGENIRIIED
jgi:hypothetical protein